MWRIVHIVDDKEKAEKLENRLNSEGFMVKVEQTGINNFQIKTTAAEADDVHNFLLQYC